MVKTFFILVFFSFNTFAYTAKEIDITNYEFNRYVKPQLKSITQGYKSLLVGLTPQLKDVSSLLNIKTDLYKLEFRLPKKCFVKQANNCNQALDQLESRLEDIINVLKKKIDIKEIKYLSMDEKILIKSHKTSFRLQIIKALQELRSLKLNATLSKDDSFSTLNLKKFTLTAIEKLDTFLLSACDNRFKKELEKYTLHFINPVLKYVLTRNRKQVFINNLNELNIRINTIAMRITKLNFPIEKKIKTLIIVAHNRWNSILKVSLVTK